MATCTPKEIAVIGYAYGDSGNISGCSDAPKLLRDLGLIQRISALGHTVTDHGDISSTADKKQLDQFRARAGAGESRTNKFAETYDVCFALEEKIYKVVKSGAYPLVLGGDHSMSIGSVAAIGNCYAEKGKSIGLLWVDTHPDCNTPETSPSNNLFGMSVAFLLGLIPGTLQGLQKKQPIISPENLAFIGLRDVDQGEATRLRSLGIACYTMKDIDIRGIAVVTEEAIAIVSRGTAGFVTSFDLDVCDPRIAPGTGTPIRGGLTYREAMLVTELIYDSKKMLGFEIVELNPKLDEDNITAEVTLSLIESALGKSIM